MSLGGLRVEMNANRRDAVVGKINFRRQRVLVPCIDRHDGILLKSEGDSLLVIFRSVRKALECSLSMQKAARDYNRGRAEAEQKIHDTMAGIGQSGAFGGFERMEERVEEKEARAKASAEREDGRER